MAFEISDFAEPKLRLEDFGSSFKPTLSVNNLTASQLAATQTILAGGGLDIYERIKGEIVTPEGREAYLNRNNQIRDVLVKEAQGELVNVLAESGVSDQEKLAAYFNSQIETTQLPPLSTTEVLSERTAVADSEPYESERDAEARNRFLESHVKTTNDKNQIANRINGLKILQNQSTFDMVADAAELMVPLAEWNHYDWLLQTLKDEFDYESKAVLLGGQKAAIYDFFKSVPDEDKARVTERLFEIVESHSNIVFPDGNALAAMETLNRMMVTNDYSDFERWFDNTVSILDVVGIGSVLRGFRSVKKPSVKALDGEILDPEIVDRPALPQPDGEIIEGQVIPPIERDAEPLQLQSPKDPLEQERDDFMVRREGQQMQEDAADEAFRSSVTPEPEDTTGKSLADEAAGFKGEPEPTPDDLFRKATAENVRSEVGPASPSQIVKDSNPRMAREMHRMVDEGTDEEATALYGANREQALSKDILPEVEIPSGRTPNKIDMQLGPYNPPEHVVDAIRTSGNIAISDEVWARHIDAIKGRIANTEHLKMHNSSLVVRANKDGSVGFTARFSPGDNGFLKPSDALEAGKFAFRNYALQSDSITLLGRYGGEWREVPLKDAKAMEALMDAGAKIPDGPTEFAIGLKYDYYFNPKDLDIVDKLTTGTGLVSRIVRMLDSRESQQLAKLGQGSLVENLFPASSVIDPRIVGAASVAVDKAVRIRQIMTEMYNEYLKVRDSFPKDRRTLLDDYTYKANLEKIPFNKVDLYNRGFTEKEIQALQKWKEANDAAYYMNNADFIESFRDKGGKIFTYKSPKGKDAYLVGYEAGPRQALEAGDVFDPVTDSIVRMGKEEIKDLYKSKGTLFRLAEPTEVDGTKVDWVLSRNTPQGGYTREILFEEPLLRYTHGYYPVSYDANYFVYKIVTNSDGTKYEKVIAAAKNTQEAKGVLEGIKRQEDLTDADLVKNYWYRKDRALSKTEEPMFDEGNWGLMTNSRMTNQKIRGERLGDAGDNLNRLGHAHLKDPIEAVNDMVRSLSRRVAMRKVLNTMKKQWMLNYEPYVDLPLDKARKPKMPQNIGEIKAKPGASEAIVADARTYFNYISSLENGYTNLIDSGYKALMHALADFAASKKLSGLEEISLVMSRQSPQTFLKTTAFKLLIALGPLRQALIQRGQMIVTATINPKYAPKSIVDFNSIAKLRLGLKGTAKEQALLKELEDSGMLEAVDANNLIERYTHRLADATLLQKAQTVSNKPVEWAQRYGFDWAEQDNLIMAWLNARDMLIREGVDITTARGKDQVLAKTRAITLQMNRAGEMPWSQNTFGLLMQFQSFPYKAILQAFTDRSLTKLQKAQLLGYGSAIFGLQASVFAGVVDYAMGKEPSEAKDIVKDGLMDVMFNTMLTKLSGEAQAIDFEDFAPVNAYGFFNTFWALTTMDAGEIIANSPAGSLFFGESARITNAFKTGFSYFFPPTEDQALNPDFMDVVVSFGRMASGFSASFKAVYALETGKALSASGNITDENISKWESFTMNFGLRTKHETGSRKVYEALYGIGNNYSDADFKSDVGKWYRELKRYLAYSGELTTENNNDTKIFREAWKVWGKNRPKAVEEIQNLLQKDALNQDYQVITGILNKMNLADPDKIWKAINALPAGQGRDMLTQIMKDREAIIDGGE